MTEQKLVELAKLVRDQTNNGNVSWQETASANQYQATLTKYVIRITSHPSNHNQGETDYIFSILNHDGTVVESFDDVELSNWIKKQNPDLNFSGYPIMEDIFKNAKRVALGVDKAVDEVLKELNGLPPF